MTSTQRRWIEMEVDSLLDYSTGHTLQFWRDVDVYGLKVTVNQLKSSLPVGMTDDLFDFLDKEGSCS